ncbi:tRNA (adenosine(37)-N6)-dimethylallyltransferase MiaA [Pseudotabrizicola sp. L79]|uniref:tRNA (adenosine(37)-N6)-dimethylallyltransferase MiaA n=1 Tax=Pseudotabrizicola sp. L79 TaxID=3118402 RepID=UPI002F924AEB
MKVDRFSQISRERPILIAGPTASGKSALAMELASRDGRVIVNADALQVYDCWRLLTARPSAEDEAAVPHQLYGHVGREDDYSVGHWLRDLRAVLAAKPVVIVGGTGLYFLALTEGLAEIPAISPQVRAEADALRRDDLAAMVAGLDAATAARIDLANPARVQRAWEVLRATGQGLADWQARTPAPDLPQDQAEALVLRPEPDWLNARIDRRFDQMMAAGALEEAQAAWPFWQPDRPWARAIGAPELMAHLDGTLTLAEAIAAAKLASRQYAKRQRTWFRSRMRDWREFALAMG